MEDAVGLIYETVADPSAWDEVMRAMAREVGASACWLFRPDEAPRLNGVGRSVFDAYNAHYGRVDLLRQEGMRRWQETAGRATRERDLVSERAWLRSELYNDFAAPNDIGHILAAPLATAPGEQPPPVLSFFRPPRVQPFDGDAVRRYEHLLPHLCRAVRLRDAVAGGPPAAVPGWTAALLDRLPAAVVLLDGAARVRHANARARAVLDARDGLLVERGGRLGALDRAAGRQLAAAVACAVSHTAGTDLRVPRAGRGQAFPWLVGVAPLPAAAGAGFGGAAPRCCVWIADAAGAPPPGVRLAALFGLTPAEQRVAAGLLRDLCPKEIARAHGVSLPTVRTQIQAIFGKLGVQRQAELVRLLAQVEKLASEPG